MGQIDSAETAELIGQRMIAAIAEERFPVISHLGGEYIVADVLLLPGMVLLFTSEGMEFAFDSALDLIGALHFGAAGFVADTYNANEKKSFRIRDEAFRLWRSGNGDAAYGMYLTDPLNVRATRGIFESFMGRMAEQGN